MRRTSSTSSSDSGNSSPRYRRNRSSSVPSSVKSVKRKTTRDCLRLLVVGDDAVGKSAIAVKLLTKRFIGTYQKDKDMVYKSNHLVVSNEDASKMLRLELLDTNGSHPCDDEGSHPAIDHLYWSSAIVIVYDVTSLPSFQYASDLLKDIKREKPNHACLLLGNKTDLDHQRKVSAASVKDLTDHYTNCLSAEVSAASTDYVNISEIFQGLFSLCQAIMSKATVKRRRSIVDMAKAFSTLLRSGSTKHSEAKTSS